MCSYAVKKLLTLVPAHPGFPGQIPQSRKTVVMCVCVCWFQIVIILYCYLLQCIALTACITLKLWFTFKHWQFKCSRNSVFFLIFISRVHKSSPRNCIFLWRTDKKFMPVICDEMKLCDWWLVTVSRTWVWYSELVRHLGFSSSRWSAERVTDAEVDTAGDDLSFCCSALFLLRR